jgi:hypothetical protein
VDWTHLKQDRVQWRALVSTVMNLRISKKDEKLLDYMSNYKLLKKGACFMELIITQL